MDSYSKIWYEALAQKAIEKKIGFLIRKMKKPVDGFKIKTPKKSFYRFGSKIKIGKSGIPMIVKATKKNKKPWQARSPIDKKYLGSFNTIEEAQKAQNEYASTVKLKVA